MKRQNDADPSFRCAAARALIGDLAAGTHQLIWPTDVMKERLTAPA